MFSLTTEFIKLAKVKIFSVITNYAFLLCSLHPEDKISFLFLETKKNLKKFQKILVGRLLLNNLNFSSPSS